MVIAVKAWHSLSETDYRLFRDQSLSRSLLLIKIPSPLIKAGCAQVAD